MRAVRFASSASGAHTITHQAPMSSLRQSRQPGRRSRPIGEGQFAGSRRSFGVSHEYAGIAFSRAAAVIEGGFAFRTRNAWILWGQATPEGAISSLCFRLDDSADPARDAPLNDLLRKYKLLFVDWNRLLVLPVTH